MARPRAFDRDQVLREAIRVFCGKGFAAASTEELMQLYLLAMAEYQRTGVDDLIERLNQGPTPLQALHDTLQSFATRALREGTAGCMGVNAICEFGLEDDEINQLTAHSAERLRNAFEQTLERAQEQGELTVGTDLSGAAAPPLSNWSALRVLHCGR
eukprot:gene14004-17028_t